MAAAILDSQLLMTMISNSGMDQSRCHWIMRLCGETADSCLCAFLGIGPYQSFVNFLYFYIIITMLAGCTKANFIVCTGKLGTAANAPFRMDCLKTHEEV